MITFSSHRRDVHSFVWRYVLRVPLFAVTFALGLLTGENATAQNRDPQAVFERTEQLEEAGVDAHFGPNCVDRLFDPFRCLDAKLDAAGGPTFLGLYAPMWQGGTQRGPNDQMISQSVNLYGEWELLHDPGHEGTLYTFYLHESEPLGTTAGQFADAIGTTILPNDDVGDAGRANRHFIRGRGARRLPVLAGGQLHHGCAVAARWWGALDRRRSERTRLSGIPNSFLGGLRPRRLQHLHACSNIFTAASIPS